MSGLSVLIYLLKLYYSNTVEKIKISQVTNKHGGNSLPNSYLEISRSGS